MTSEVDVVNRALGKIGTRTSVASLVEGSPESINALVYLEPRRDELLRMAPWNCCRNFNQLALAAAAPGTPENPGTTNVVWVKGLPPPPWAYEYIYPSDCLRPLWIVPQFTTGFSTGIPITTAVTGGAPQFWQGPPVRFSVGIDQIDPNTGLPANPPQGQDARVIWTNQEFAVLAYNRRVTNPDVMDESFIEAWTSCLAGDLAIALTGDKTIANMKLKEANERVQIARSIDGNEGLTINNVTPDWIRVRGLDFPADYGWSPNLVGFDWGNMISLY